MKRSTTLIALTLAVASLASGGVASIAYTISGRPRGNGYYDWGSTIDNVLG